MGNNIDVSIIIVNYNTSCLINPCIDSIFRLTSGISYEIIIVDNNTEDLSTTIAYADDPRIKIVQLPENVGFGRANNAGAEISCGKNLLLLNPDTILINNAVKILCDYLNQHPECGASGGNLYNENGAPIHSYKRVLPGIVDSLDILSNHLLSGMIWGKNSQNNHTGHPLKVGYITGADLMIPRKVYQEVNGFDPQFFLYYEETDLCCRIKDMGYDIISVPEAKIVHLVGKSHDDGNMPNEFVFKCEGFSRNLYYRKHLSSVARFITKLILYINYILRLAVFTLQKKRAQRALIKYRFKYL